MRLGFCIFRLLSFSHRFALKPWALVCACLPVWLHAQQPVTASAPVLDAVTVHAAPVSGDAIPQMLAPVKVLAGDELSDKLAGSLGETLSRELGVKIGRAHV